MKEVWYCAEEDKPIDRADMVKGYETAKGKYVVVEDEELKKIAPTTATTMDILQFVGGDEVDPVYFECYALDTKLELPANTTRKDPNTSASIRETRSSSGSNLRACFRRQIFHVGHEAKTTAV